MSHASRIRRLFVAGSLLVPALAFPLVGASTGGAAAEPSLGLVHGVVGAHVHGGLSRTWV